MGGETSQETTQESILERSLKFELPSTMSTLYIEVEASIQRYRRYRGLVNNEILRFGAEWGTKYNCAVIGQTVMSSDIKANPVKSLNSADYDVYTQCVRLVEYLEQRNVAEKVPNIFRQIQYVVDTGRITVNKDQFTCRVAPQMLQFLQQLLKACGHS